MGVVNSIGMYCLCWKRGCQAEPHCFVPYRATVFLEMKGDHDQEVFLHVLTFVWEVCTLVPCLLHVLDDTSFFSAQIRSFLSVQIRSSTSLTALVRSWKWRTRNILLFWKFDRLYQSANNFKSGFICHWICSLLYLIHARPVIGWYFNPILPAFKYIPDPGRRILPPS